ncbi:MAG: hypothetical protein IKA73_03975 [Alphaproteobacteria bacterium]|nr:hypothetical protein [Alphaproteobacteria bacterium]
MKNLFTFSVLSMLAVMGVAQAELAGEGFVTAGRINQELYGFTKNESVVRSTGQALNGIADISDDVAAKPDKYIPTVGMVEANFVPNVATTYKDDYFREATDTMQPGLYTIMVEVDENGNKTFIWQAVQQARGVSSVGGVMPN